MKKAILPIVRWAQRQDKVFISVDVRDIKEEKIDLTATTLTFSCTAEDQDYAFTLNFNKPINEKESSFSKFGVGLRFIIIKQERGWWTRLAAETLKFQHIQVDWSKYIDEDDEEEAGGKGLEDWDQNNFQNFQGGQGEGGDEDDEEEGGDDGNQINDDLEKEEQVGGQQAEEQPEKKEHKEEEAQQ